RPPALAEITASPDGSGPDMAKPKASGNIFSISSGTKVARKRSGEVPPGATVNGERPTENGWRLVPRKYDCPSESLQSKEACSSFSFQAAASNDPAACSLKSP